MTLYSFRCRNCSMEVDSQVIDLHNREGCPHCNGPLKKLFLVTTQPLNTSFEPHFNHTVGEVVHSWSDFTSKLEKKSDLANAAGYKSNFSPIHPADMKPQNLGVDNTENV